MVIILMEVNKNFVEVFINLAEMVINFVEVFKNFAEMVINLSEMVRRVAGRIWGIIGSADSVATVKDRTLGTASSDSSIDGVVVVATADYTLLIYIRVRDEQVKAGNGALFVTRKGERMSGDQVRNEVKRCLSLVSTLSKRSPHVLRHTFATAMLNHEAGLESVKKLLGHESLSTTEIYTHTTFEQLKRVYQEAHPRA